MKRILSFILAVCLVLTLAPVVIYAEEPTLGEATLIADYTFDSEFLSSDFGKMMFHDYTTSNSAYTVSYPEDGGVRITKNSKIGTSSKSVARIGVDFGKIIDEEKSIYQLGLSGVYAMDITIRGELVKGKGTSGRTDAFFSDVPGDTATETSCNIRMSPGYKVEGYEGTLRRFVFSKGIVAEPATYRFVFDTVNHTMKGYEFKNGDFVYVGEAACDLDSLATFMYSPRDKYLAEGSYIEIDRIKVYEYSDSTSAFADTFKKNMPESFNYVSGGKVDATAVTESISFPESWSAYTIKSTDESVLKTDGTVIGADADKEVTLTVECTESGAIFKKDYKFNIKADSDYSGGTEEPPVDPEPPVETDDPLLGGRLVFNYDLNKEFAETELGKQVIVDNIATCGYDYETIYTDKGITLVKNFDPLYTNDAQTTGATTNAFGLNLSALIDNDKENGNRMYQTGFTGLYAFEFTMNINQSPAWATSGNKSSGRSDIYITDSASNFKTTNSINVRMSYKNFVFAAHTDSVTVCSLGALHSGEDKTLRFVIDTVNHKFVCYTKNDDGTYTAHTGEGSYGINSVAYLWYCARSFCEKGDSITFKNMKLYELSKDETSQGTEYFNVANSTLPDSFMDVDGNTIENNSVNKSIVIPDEFSNYAVETSDKNLLTAQGKVTRNNYEDKPVTLTVSGNSYGVHFTKIYDFMIKARDDISIKNLAKYDYETADDLIYSGDNRVTAEGYELVNKKYTDATTVGLLKSKKSTDKYSETHIFDYEGAYDFEIDLIPNITSGEAFVEIGNYNADTKNFESFGSLKIKNDGFYYSDEYEDLSILKDNVSGKDYKLKFRTDTNDKAFWVWVNGITNSEYGFAYENDKTLNAYRIGFVNAAENDKVVIKEADFTQLVYKNTDAVLDALNVADTITANSIVSDPEDAYGKINLPKVNGYNIEWSTDNALADLNSKMIYRSFNDEDITVTAIISAANNSAIKVRKDFKLKVKGTSDFNELVAGSLAKITAESVTKQKLLVTDLKLPSVTAEGYDVKWESLSKGYISDAGVINKTINIDENKDVTFKVTVSSNGVSKDKNITFKVAKRGADVVLSTADITESAEGVVTYKATISGNGSAYLKDGNGNNIIGFNVNNSKLYVDCKNTDNAQYDVNSTFEISIVMNMSDRCASILVDDKVIADCVSYLSPVDGFKNTVADGISLTNEKVVFDEYALFNYNVKLFDYLSSFENVFVAENRVLVNDSIGGVNVKWVSSNPAVMKDNGTFTAPVSVEFYDMVLILSMKSGSGAKLSMVTKCVAVPTEDKNLVKNAIFTSDLKEDVTSEKINMYDGSFTSYMIAYDVKDKNYITIQLDELKEINSLYFFQKEDGIKSCDVYLSNDGANWRGPVASPVFTDLNSNLVVFDYQDVKYIKISNIVADNNTFKLYELKGYLAYTSNNKAQFDIDTLNMPKDYNLNVSSINLPEVGSVYGSKLTWSSTKPDVISTNGEINKPGVATEVILTVVAEFDGKTATKNFTYLVPAAKSGGSGGAGGGGGGYAGNISGINAGGAGLAATPTTPEVELEKVETPKVENGIFTDTPKDAWYYDYLTDLVEKGIVNGYDDGNFNPNNQVTREEFLKMLISAIGVELTDKTTEYSDVKADDWFAPYVYTAKESGIASGISNGEFGVGMPISRQDMCVMIYNITDKNAEFDDGIFTDHSSIAKYAFNAVYAIKAMGIVNGYENGEFRPEGKLTRAEAVKVISLVLKMQ